MLKLLDTFKAYCQQPYRRAAEWRAESKGKVIGCLPMYFPDEIVHAAGVLPVALSGVTSRSPWRTDT